MSHLFQEKSNNYFMNYKLIQNQETTQDIDWTSWSDLTGSVISYVPSANSDYVIYEYGFFIAKKIDDVVNIGCKLLYSDDGGLNWSEYGSNTHTAFGSIHTTIQETTIRSVKLCLDSWGNSEKKLKLQGKPFNYGGADATLHKLSAFYDNSGLVSSDRYIKPYVSCYSVRSQ